MKKIIFSILILSVTNSMLAQVTIGSTIAPDPNAILDLKTEQDGSSIKGLLLPRVSLKGINNPYPLRQHIAGMFVFNTQEDTRPSNTLAIGTYYNDGSNWILLAKEKQDKPSQQQTISVSNGLIMVNNKIKLGGELTERTTISGITGMKKLEFKGTGSNAMNFFDFISLNANSFRVAIGKGQINPLETLDIAGTLRIGGMTTRDTRTLLGRDATGGVNAVQAESGLHLNRGGLRLGGPLTTSANITGVTGDKKFSIEGDGLNAVNLLNTLSVHGTYHRIGIGEGNTYPNATLDVKGTVLVSEDLTVQKSAQVVESLRVGRLGGTDATLRIEGTASLATLGTADGKEIIGRAHNNELTTIRIGDGLTFSQGELKFGGPNTVVEAKDIIHSVAVVRENSVYGYTLADHVSTIWVSAVPGLNPKGAHITLPRNARVGRVVTIKAAMSNPEAIIAIRAQSLSDEQDIVDGVITTGTGQRFSFSSNKKFTLKSGQSVTLQYVGREYPSVGEWLVIKGD